MCSHRFFKFHRSWLQKWGTVRIHDVYMDERPFVTERKMGDWWRSNVNVDFPFHIAFVETYLIKALYSLLAPGPARIKMPPKVNNYTCTQKETSGRFQKLITPYVFWRAESKFKAKNSFSGVILLMALQIERVNGPYLTSGHWDTYRFADVVFIHPVFTFKLLILIVIKLP